MPTTLGCAASRSSAGHRPAIPFPLHADGRRRCTRHREIFRHRPHPGKARQFGADAEADAHAGGAGAATTASTGRHSRENRDGNGCRRASAAASQRRRAVRGRSRAALSTVWRGSRLRPRAARNCFERVSTPPSVPAPARRDAPGHGCVRQGLSTGNGRTTPVRP